MNAHGSEKIVNHAKTTAVDTGAEWFEFDAAAGSQIAAAPAS